MQIDHVGIATADAADLGALYTDLFDATVVHEETFNDMQVVFLDFGNATLELLEPLSDNGTIASYLDRNGSGIHHLAVETESVQDALDQARDLDIHCIDEEPRPGAWGHDVAFLHPKDTGGVLIEFVEH